MDGFLRRNMTYVRCRKLRVILAILWIAGLMLGAYVASLINKVFSSSPLTVLEFNTPISGLIVSLLLPLFITVVAVCTSQKWLLYVLVCLKSFLFSYAWIGSSSVFNTSAWLLRALLMFGDSLSLVILWWMWLKIDFENRAAAFFGCIPVTICLLLIAYFDYALVVPFLARLI